jgi:hypothetical protein
MRISDQYRDANRRLHESNDRYGTSSAKWASKVAELAQQTSSQRILDYGCGKGMLKAALPDLPVDEYDPAIPGKEREPAPTDLVVCTDVLEHIEPDCLDDVLDHLRRLTLKRAFLNVATRRASKSLPDGRNAHLIVQTAAWWRRRIGRYFEVLEWRASRKEFNCVLRPRDIIGDAPRGPDPAGWSRFLPWRR